MSSIGNDRFQNDKSRHDASKASSSTSRTDKTPIGMMRDRMTKFELNFGENLQNLLHILDYYAATETAPFLGLCVRLSTVKHGTEFSGMGIEEQGEV